MPGASSRSTSRTGAPAGRARSPAASNHRRSSPRAAVLRLGGRHGLRLQAGDGRSAGPTRRGRGQDGLALATQALLRRLRRKVTALRRATASASGSPAPRGSAFGLQAGRFYATPAVAYGPRLHRQPRGSALLVRLGRLEAFAGAHKDRRHFIIARGGDGGGGRPTYYAGPNDGEPLRFDAARGSVRWTQMRRHHLRRSRRDRDLVFYSNLSRRSNGALGVATGGWCGRWGPAPSTRDQRREAPVLVG